MKTDQSVSSDVAGLLNSNPARSEPGDDCLGNTQDYCDKILEPGKIPGIRKEVFIILVIGKEIEIDEEF